MLGSGSTGEGVITARKMVVEFNGQYTGVHVYWLEDPAKYFSIEEPIGGCGNRARVSHTSKYWGCTVASNAGFFNTKTGGCLGNIVSRGNLIQNSGRQNANFGIREDGMIVTGFAEYSFF